MGTSSRCGRCVHAGDDVADIRAVHTPGAPPFWETTHRVAHLTLVAILVAPWTALAAIVRQKEAFARSEAGVRTRAQRARAAGARRSFASAAGAGRAAFPLQYARERQALVDAGSPHASAVLRSLTAYLRAAVPLLHESAATIERELQLVRPYLELMQMRMPDRLQYERTSTRRR